MSAPPLAVVILAAGQGTRMNSETPKVLHPLAGIPLISHVVATAEALDADSVSVVVRHAAEEVAQAVADQSDGVVIVHQDEVPGTGRAVEVALESLDASIADVVVLSADVPLLDSDTVRAVIGLHRDAGAAVTLLSAIVDDPTGYGRILRRGDGSVERIVEQGDTTAEEREVTEINAGIYVFSHDALTQHLPALGHDNAQEEKYLTDVIARVVAADGLVHAVQVEDAWLVDGVNDRVQLSEVQRRLNRMIVRGWQRDGVSIPDPDSVWIDLSVTLAPDVTVLPGVHLEGHTHVGEGATIGPDCTVRDSDVGAGARVERSVVHDAEIHAEATIGPFAYLRPGTVVESSGKVGTFVETKNSRIGAGAKVPHLSYIGDADIGEGANIGAGTITANYDGVNKHRTVVGAHAKTGSDNVFVAPVEIGPGAYTAAGTTIRRDVPAGSLAVAPVAVKTVEGWVAANRPDSEADIAARSHSPGSAQK